jgi:acetylornithine deacetylase/succinyl-diaminopimelate desuccinylase-like protein
LGHAATPRFLSSLTAAGAQLGGTVELHFTCDEEAGGEIGPKWLLDDMPVLGVQLYTDARHYVARSIPIVLYGAGPRSLLEANAHNADENLRLNDLRAATKIISLAVADLLGCNT